MTINICEYLDAIAMTIGAIYQRYPLIKKIRGDLYAKASNTYNH